MAQTAALLKELKKVLRAHGLTYVDVAKALDLTEASVKRLFSEQSFSLQRLDQVCQLMNMEISDLVVQMTIQQPQLQQLSEEQEKEIAEDLLLLMVTVCVLNRWTLEDMLDHYQLEISDCIQKLAQLDRLKIIELLPKNRIKLLVAPNFCWRDNGPIQRFFQEKIQQEYFDTRFKRSDEQLIVLNGMFSTETNAEFQRKMKKLAREFDDLNSADSGLPLQQRHGSTVVIAMRSWRYGLFSPYRKAVC
jgi:DNA-binding Xre family transcriptional regulator